MEKEGKMSDDKRGEEKELDLSLDVVVHKYKAAAAIVNRALERVLSECKINAKIADICEIGDSYIREQTESVYKNVIEKGVAFPTCLSLNTLVSHCSPLASDLTTLKEGEMLKIDMGCHIDGFIALVAHTYYLQEGPITGRAADVIAAANTAAEVALRLVRPGKKIQEATEAIQKVAAKYDCKILEGSGITRLKQQSSNAGTKVVLGVLSPDTEVEKNQVYIIDILASTGAGELDVLPEGFTTVYKRNGEKNSCPLDTEESLIISKICEKFPIMPFSARALKKEMALSEKSVKLGLTKLANKGLLQSYPLCSEKNRDFVAHIKFTVLLMPNESQRVTSHTLPELKTTKAIDDPEIKAWLAIPLKSKKKKNRDLFPQDKAEHRLIVKNFTFEDMGYQFDD